jgi:peptidoglycan/LPS O-acetylase OafA/YrhL
VLAVFVLRLLYGLAMPPLLAQPPGTPVEPLSDTRRWIVQRAFNILIGAAFVIAGARMAPRRRRTTAIVLTVLWILYSAMIHVVVHLGRGKPHFADFALSAAAAVCGAAFIAYSERSKTGRE